MSRLARLTVLAVLGGVLLVATGGSGASGSETCGTNPLVCVSVTGTPATVAPSQADSPHYVSYVAEVENRGSSTVTHVTARWALTGGLALVSADTSVGSCTTADGVATCTLGNLAGGATAAVSLVARAPQSEGTATAAISVSFDETFNDGTNPDPKQDTLTASAQTSVAAVEGSDSSFVPEGTSVDLSTDPTGTGVATPTDSLIGGAHITSAPASVTALIEEVAAPVACPKRVICRGGGWLHASIPGTFDPPLAFPLRWDKSLIPKGLNDKKFAVIYTECLDGCPLQVITARCSSATPDPSELPCLTGVAKLPDGDWKATLVNNHNGHMR
jgi:uncharacterized protein DUF11